MYIRMIFKEYIVLDNMFDRVADLRVICQVTVNICIDLCIELS